MQDFLLNIFYLTNITRLVEKFAKDGDYKTVMLFMENSTQNGDLVQILPQNLAEMYSMFHVNLDTVEKLYSRDATRFINTYQIYSNRKMLQIVVLDENTLIVNAKQKLAFPSTSDLVFLIEQKSMQKEKKIIKTIQWSTPAVISNKITVIFIRREEITLYLLIGRFEQKFAPSLTIASKEISKYISSPENIFQATYGQFYKGDSLRMLFSPSPPRINFYENTLKQLKSFGSDIYLLNLLANQLFLFQTWPVCC